MTRREFETALQRVADSAKRAGGAPAVGRLGIGIFSFQQIGRTCTFYSRKTAAAETIAVVLKEGRDEAQVEAARARDRLEAPGLRIVISDLKFDPPRARGPLAPDILRRSLAEKFESYLREGWLEIVHRVRRGRVPRAAAARRAAPAPRQAAGRDAARRRLEGDSHGPLLRFCPARPRGGAAPGRGGRRGPRRARGLRHRGDRVGRRSRARASGRGFPHAAPGAHLVRRERRLGGISRRARPLRADAGRASRGAPDRAPGQAELSASEAPRAQDRARHPRFGRSATSLCRAVWRSGAGPSRRRRPRPCPAARRAGVEHASPPGSPDTRARRAGGGFGYR